MKSLSAEAVKVMASVTCEGSMVRLPPGQLDRKLYVEVDAALASLGGKWSRKEKAHVFEEDPSNDIDAIVTAGGWVDRKKDLDQFFTPAPLAVEVVARAEVKRAYVLEPSAGRGALASECFTQDARAVMLVEIDKKNVEDLKRRQYAVLRHNFIHLPAAPDGVRFTRVVMNPPFSKQADITHVMHAYNNFLAPGGRLVSIMSAGVEFRSTNMAKAFRALVSEVGTLERLPDGSFSESGTEVRTVLVVLNKPKG